MPQTNTTKPRCAVVILNWNGAKLLQEFLPSVIADTPSHLAEVIVVDNGSTDNSIDIMDTIFPDVTLITFDHNYGFAGGYNKALQMIDYEYVVLLNSDVQTSPHWLEPLIDTLENNEQIAVVQPKIKAYKSKEHFEYAGACGGYIDELGFPFCRGRILDTVEKDEGQYDNNVNVFWCSGAAFCVRRNIYTLLGGLDEAFFAHMEEIDLCWRILNQGYLAQVIPSATVYHLGGGSLPMNHPRKLFLNYRNNLLMLYKNLSPQQHRIVSIKRGFIDFSAMCTFLLKGQLSNVFAVISAYRDYWRLKHNYTPIPSSSQINLPIFKGLIIWEALVKGKKKFSQLPLLFRAL